jgi:hypothetical protein
MFEKERRFFRCSFEGLIVGSFQAVRSRKVKFLEIVPSFILWNGEECLEIIKEFLWELCIKLAQN